jgi:hypothetical protein
VDFKWICPVKGCDYLIDMLNLSNINMHRLNDKTVRALSGNRRQSILEEMPETAFYQMVFCHWEDHLAESGLKWVSGTWGSQKVRVC